MNNKYFIPLLIFLTIFLSSCASGARGFEGESCSIYVYMCGSNLETKNGAATKNIAELISSELPEDVNVVIQTGGADRWRDYDIPSDEISRYELKEGELSLVDSQPQSNMGEEDTLKDFLLYGISEYPADRKCVILWDHGSGNEPGICFDENYDMDRLTISELDGAFSAAKDENEEDFEFIAYDACLMGNLETALMTSKYAKNMMASQDLEPTGGWDYTALGEALSSKDFYGTMMDAYREKCEDAGKQTYTLAHTDLQQLEGFSEDFDAFSSHLNEMAGNGLKPVADAAINSLSFGHKAEKEGYSDMIDLGDFAENADFAELKEKIKNSTVTVNSEDKAGASGISIYYPLTDIEKVETYLAQAADTEYKSFLESNYTNIPDGEDLISFTDPGSDASGELHVELSEASKKYIQSIEYELFRFVSETEYYERIFSLGTDSDIISDGKNGYTTSFEGKWVTLQGEFIHCSVVGKTDSLTTFSTPVILNGEQGSIRFLYDSRNKTFATQGFLPFSNEGAASRPEELQKGDSITLLFDERTLDYSQTLYEGKEFTYDGKDDYDVETFPDGYFQLMITAKDIFGNVYYSDSAVVELKDGELRIDTIDHVDGELF